MANVSLKHVYKIYDGGVTAVTDFNLEIADKEFIILVGPSGCGKSTTLRMIAGLEDISKGELYIGDMLANDVAPKDRDIAMVFQNYALYPHMTVYDNMAFSLSMRKERKNVINERVMEAAKLLQIENYLYSKGIYYIFYNNQIKISEIIVLLKNEKQDSNLELKKELEELKKILLKNEEKEKKRNIFLIDNIKNILKKNITNHLKNIKENITEKNRFYCLHNNKITKNILNNNTKSEIICITGTSGVGKSIFSVNLAKSFMINKKIYYYKYYLAVTVH